MKIRTYLFIVPLIFLAACSGKEKETDTVSKPPLVKEIEAQTDSIELDTVAKDYNLLGDKQKEDIRAKMSKADFEKLEGAELEMALVRPIYSKIFDVDEDASLVIPNLTEGQKTLYFLRKIDESVTSGELESWVNNTPKALIIQAQTSLYSLSNKRMDAVFNKVNETISAPELSIKGVDKSKKMKKFKEDFSNTYNMEHDNLYKNMADYIKNHPEEFVIFTD